MINISNRLKIYNGNVIMLPGCEPLSEFTSQSLAANMSCSNSYINLADALSAIPAATIIMFSNPKEMFFVLPDGPPSKYGCADCDSQDDWYQILKDAVPSTTVQSESTSCDVFPVPRCP